VADVLPLSEPAWALEQGIRAGARRVLRSKAGLSAEAIIRLTKSWEVAN
jgi:hypothetical protein